MADAVFCLMILLYSVMYITVIISVIAKKDLAMLLQLQGIVQGNDWSESSTMMSTHFKNVMSVSCP